MFISNKEIADVLFEGGKIPVEKSWPLIPVGYSRASAFFERQEDGGVRFGTKESASGNHEECIAGKGRIDDLGLHVSEDDADVFYAFIGMVHSAKLRNTQEIMALASA